MADTFLNSSGQCVIDTQVCIGEGTPFPVNWTNSGGYNSLTGAVHCSDSGLTHYICNGNNTIPTSSKAVPGFLFSGGTCQTDYQNACTTANKQYSNTAGCHIPDPEVGYYSVMPTACVFAEGSSGSGNSSAPVGNTYTCTTGACSMSVDIPALTFLTDSQYAQYVVYAGLMAFAVGFMAGLVVRMIRRLG